MTYTNLGNVVYYIIYNIYLLYVYIYIYIYIVLYMSIIFTGPVHTDREGLIKNSVCGPRTKNIESRLRILPAGLLCWLRL